MTVSPLLMSFVLAAAPAIHAQAKKLGDAQTIVLATDRLELTIRATGGTFLKLLLRGQEPLNPLATIGHFVALDGFGAPSDQEQALGMPFHGEASRQPVDVTTKLPNLVTMQTVLPLSQEILTRTVEGVDGENIIYVTSRLESALSVDRPMSWAEHATIGPPFLEEGKVVVDMPASNCRVRPFKPGPIPGHLVYNRDFKWPMAPTIDGGEADLRLVPTDHHWLDLASCQMDPSRSLAFVTALHLGKHLVFGYVFRREDYPWLMSWMNYTGDNRAARGMEFSSQPFDISHRETVAMSPLFGTPTFRWLPAKSTLETRFLMFYTKLPDSFTKIEDVTLEGGNLTIQDHSGKRVVLAASKGF